MNTWLLRKKQNLFTNKADIFVHLHKGPQSLLVCDLNQNRGILINLALQEKLVTAALKIMKPASANFV
jgi:hypothetical protein